MESIVSRSYLKRPYPDLDLFQDNLEAGFKKYPERRENYLNYKASKRDEKIDYIPIKLDIENVSRCNYLCNMCQASDWLKGGRAADMSFKDYKELIDQQYGLIEIKIQGMGEPLLGECYFRMIKYAREKFIWVRSTTNGSLLHLKENYKALIYSDISEIQVSIDGATAKTYERIRKGGRFDRVKENSILLNNYCHKVNRKRTRMWVLVQRENYHELEQFPVLAEELGFARLTFALDLTDWRQDEWKIRIEKINTGQIFDQKMAETLIKIGKKKGVEVTFWDVAEKFNTDKIEHLCPWPFERLYISSDMRIVPCCGISNPNVLNLGDARDLSKEWNNEKIRKFRKMHLEGNIPSICKSCYAK